MALDITATRASGTACALACFLLGAGAVSSDAAAYRVTGTGYVTDSGHSMHPGWFRTYNLKASVTFDPVPDEAVIVLEYAEADSQGQSGTDLYYVRRGRIFQVDGKGAEILPGSFGDVNASAIAALHPALVLHALRERPECVRRVEGGLVFAWNDELWTLDLDPGSAAERVTALRFDVASYVFGDQTLEVRYGGWPRDPSATSPGRVAVNTLGREVMRIDFTTTEKADSVGIATGDRKRDRQWVANAAEIVPREIAPHLFSIDLASLNMRTFVAEFSDHLMVFDGVWDPRNSDPIVARREHFKKPVRYYAFSHIHSQYVAGARSYVHEGATVLVPPTTAPLIETMVQEGRRLRPDALAAEPRPLRMETVPKRRRLKDRINTVEIYNIESDHTDEYLIVYFPRQKVLLTGDLLFYYPGKPLTGRSLKLCETVRKLGLDVETYVTTWPLDGYGTGDSLSIGLGQMCHAIRRNVRMLYVIENNGVYGLTKGQFSASADVGSKLKKGEVNQMAPIDPVFLGLSIGATFVARSFSGDKQQLVPILKAGLKHRGLALVDVISPCVTFNDHEGSTKSYLYTRRHEKQVAQADLVPPAEEISAPIGAKGVTTIAMHDGSLVRFSAVPEGYDPGDRAKVYEYLQKHQSQGVIPTGLLYLDESVPDMHEMNNTSVTPLIQVPFESLCPGSNALEKLMEDFR